MRTLVDLPEQDVAGLDALAKRNSRSRAAEVRDAVRSHLRRCGSGDWINAGAGYWKDRHDIGDGVAYQQSIREDRDLDPHS